MRRDQKTGRPAIFKEKLCPIAEKNFSLDDIEHGILRRYRAKTALGYWPNIFAPTVIKKLAVKTIDYRIHFALNCGAISCPPIAFYTPDRLEQQLDWASLSFLENETEYLADKNELHFSRLGLWYLGDFGGCSGIRRLVQKYLKTGAPNSKVVFKDYNWAENLDNFAPEQP